MPISAVLGSGKIALKDTLRKPIRHGWRWAVTVCPPSYVPPRCGTRRRRRVDGLKLAQRLLAGTGGNWCVRTLAPAPAATNRLLWPGAIFTIPAIENSCFGELTQCSMMKKAATDSFIYLLLNMSKINGGAARAKRHLGALNNEITEFINK